MFLDTEKRPQGEPQKVGTLKLSEAIRIGVRGTRQATDGCYYQRGKACAWGAAAIGLGERGDADAIASLASDLHGGRKEPHFRVSAMAFHRANGFSMIDANDRQGWSRERIAEALESLGY